MTERDLVVISQHERGFWMADFYHDTTPEEQRLSGRAPDGFCTCPTEVGVRLEAAGHWPGALFVDAEVDEHDDD